MKATSNIAKAESAEGKQLKDSERQIKVIQFLEKREEETIKHNKITNTVIQVNGLVAQFEFEINTLSEIIQAARVGIIHMNLLSQEQLLYQLKDITA